MVRASVISRLQGMTLDEMLANDPPSDQMLLDDLLQHRRIAGPVPRAFRIHDRDRSAFADSKAVGLGAQDAALVGESELLEPAFQEIPGGQAPLLLAALRRRLIAAEKDVTAGDRDAYRSGDLLLRVGHQKAKAAARWTRVEAPTPWATARLRRITAAENQTPPPKPRRNSWSVSRSPFG